MPQTRHEVRSAQYARISAEGFTQTILKVLSYMRHDAHQLSTLSYSYLVIRTLYNFAIILQQHFAIRVLALFPLPVPEQDSFR